MTINTVELWDRNVQPYVTGISKAANLLSGRFANIPLDEAIAAKRGKLKKKKHSPYLNGDRIQLLSRITEKRFVHKKNELYSSFPLASNIYRANSDEFKAIKRNRRKPKKSVLTLPNVPAPIPQSCTVSDMNDSEYYKGKKKRLPKQNSKFRVRTKAFEFYDRDADHINLDTSSTDLMGKNYDGDGRNVSNKLSKNTTSDDLTTQDVWAVLRNINKFQFRPSPRISETSLIMPKKKKNFIKRSSNKRNSRRLIETCRTQEIAYVTNFEIQSKDSVSPSSSFDRITVINRNELLKKPMVSEKAFSTNIKQRISNKTKNLVPLYDKTKHVAKIPLRTIQYNNRNDLFKKNRYANGKIYHDALNEKVESTCTIKESIDSSNDFRKSDSDYSTKKKTLKHPTEIKEIILHCPRKITVLNNPESVSSTERMVKGTTRVVFHDPNVVLTGKSDVQKPKPRLVTTMPSAAAMPRLTTSDIKRRIAQIKFPLVILGKDQLSSTIEVLDYEPPQFRGLDEHIWPYMVEWLRTNGYKSRNNLPNSKKVLPVDRITSNFRKVSHELNVVKTRDKKTLNTDAPAIKKLDYKREPQYEENSAPLSAKKTKPMRQFKDKMLRLLYKKPSMYAKGESDEPVKNVLKENEVKLVKVDVSTETPRLIMTGLDEMTNNSPIKPNDAMVKMKKHLVCPPNSLPIVYNQYRLPDARLPWARAKWANEFIENVMKKIKSGVYYYHEGKCSLSDETHTIVGLKNNTNSKLDAFTHVDYNDVSVQTFSVSVLGDIKERTGFEDNIDEYDVDNLSTINSREHTISLPGFDDTPPELEIKILNANQIAVKHSLSNVMVHFDIAVPDKSTTHLLVSSKSTASSCVPLPVTSSHTRIFKCNTTIFNAVLPAELCTVIPKVMRKIFDSDTSLTINTSTTESYATISEISEYDSAAPSISTCRKEDHNTVLSSVSNQWMYPQYSQWVYPQRDQWMSSQTDWSTLLINQSSCTQRKQWENTNTPWFTNGLLTASYGRPHCLPLYLSPALKEYISGRFSPIGILQKKQKTVLRHQLIPRIILLWSESTILPHLCAKSIMYCVVDPMELSICENKKDGLSPFIGSRELALSSQPISDYTALLPFTGGQELSVPSQSNFSTLLQNTWAYCKFNIHLDMPSYINPLDVIYDKNSLTVNMVVGNNQGIEKKMSVTVSNLQIDSLYDRLANNEKQISYLTNKALPVKCLEYYPEKSGMIKTGKKCSPAKKRQDKHRKGYVKLYKKCKSTSNISGEKQCTSLSKIANLDDFFQALGSARVLSSVFDGCVGNKVLACVREMKSWIKDITPRQALLVLLLTNKKDTPNLVQFRPVLLQGIAVNRITRATELDMEIEVIERENIKIIQYDGISYIPASVDNQDNLLEELCWIAKNTASDYQRPFDESSQRLLLKSLLEKRKKLNPSYLRVMARYVGLGLLKTPVKHENHYVS